MSKQPAVPANKTRMYCLFHFIYFWVQSWTAFLTTSYDKNHFIFNYIQKYLNYIDNKKLLKCLVLIDYWAVLSFTKRHCVFSIAGLNFCACTISNDKIFDFRTLDNFFVTNDFSLDIFKFDWNTVCLNVLNITIGKL